MVKKNLLQLFITLVMIIILVFSFVLIIMYTNKNRPKKESELYEINTIGEGLVQTIAYYLVKPILESTLDRYIQKHGLTEYLRELMQQDKELVNFYEISEGNGDKAFCGQEVSLQIYKISNSSNLLSLSNQASDITLEIGKYKLKDLSFGIIGMKEGGERVVTTIGGDNFYVKLVEIKDKYPDSANNLMIFNNSVSKTGKRVKCGDEISIKYSVMDHSGEPVVKDQALQFKVGDKKIPLAIELGVVGMRSGNNRTIISPPELLSVTEDMVIKDMHFDEENISIIDLSIDNKEE
ncbi:MAG: hypothetical protein PG981_001224 [Wolbachia endosymbiont of Ctenocephalides orientis wCori]|nr:MAG: hypothetical protein PG981_001224 [Wolbachia endosymbiont of Ctenocephalides orientis wCori]